MRDSYKDFAEQRKNVIKNIGYEYRGQVFRKTLSRMMFLDPERASILNALDDLMVFMIDGIKNIKKQMNYTLPKNYRDFN